MVGVCSLLFFAVASSAPLGGICPSFRLFSACSFSLCSSAASPLWSSNFAFSLSSAAFLVLPVASFFCFSSVFQFRSLRGKPPPSAEDFLSLFLASAAAFLSAFLAAFFAFALALFAAALSFFAW